MNGPEQRKKDHRPLKTLSLFSVNFAPSALKFLFFGGAGSGKQGFIAQKLNAADKRAFFAGTVAVVDHTEWASKGALAQDNRPIKTPETLARNGNRHSGYGRD